MKIRETIQEPMMTHLLQLCQQVLELDDLPPINLVSDKPALKSGDKNSFGQFDGSSIFVVTTDRHPMDVMRTLAHELTHWKQRVEGMDMDGEDGSDIENQANSIAGIILRKFGEKYPEYFINSIP